MKIIKKISELQTEIKKHKLLGKTIALVPTMGYLHKGHASLIIKAKELADIVVTSIFVNPTQFAPNEDFEKYPRNIERDSLIAESANNDYLFIPEIEEMYPDIFNTNINIKNITNKFEGSFRPTHFDGVATIVAKLFNASLADTALFGQKDYQQTLVIKSLAKDLNFPIRIIITPTIREKDGLALSSRNVYLSTEERQQAIIINQTLYKTINLIQNGENNRKTINAFMQIQLSKIKDVIIDYASSAIAENLEEPEFFEKNTNIVLLIALKIGKTRLIDNMLTTII